MRDDRPEDRRSGIVVHARSGAAVVGTKSHANTNRILHETRDNQHRGKTEASIRAAKPNNPQKQRSNPTNARGGPMKDEGWGGTAPDTDNSQGGPGRRPPGNKTYPERRINSGRRILVGQIRVGDSWKDQSGQETTQTKTTPAGESPQKQETNLSMDG